MADVLDHVGIQCADLAASAAFYDVVLEPLGGQRIMDFGVAIGYGVAAAAGLLDQRAGRRVTASVSRTWRSPRRAGRPCGPSSTRRWPQGAQVLHEPRLWPEYHETYYGAFVRDPDGNNVEAVCHLPE